MEKLLSRVDAITKHDHDILMQAQEDLYEKIIEKQREVIEAAKWISAGWIVNREDGTKEVVIGALTDDVMLYEGDEAVPFALPSPPEDI